VRPRRGDAPAEAGLPSPARIGGEVPDEERERRKDPLDVEGELVESEDDASLRPLARALLALAEQLSQEKGP